MLSPKQLQFAAACREADKPDGPTEIGYGGARGGGKSHCQLSQMAVDDCQRVPNLKCLLLRKVGKANAENLNDLRMRILTHVPHTFAASRGIITFPNGSRIIAGHFQNEGDINAYLGLEYDVIGVEEATTLKKSKYRDIQTCCRTSKPHWRPRMYSNCNPGGIGHVWYRAKFIVPYRGQCQTGTRFIPALVTDNPHNNPDYVHVLDNLTGWQLRAWRHGDWDIAAGQFFTTFRREIHCVDVFDERRAVQWWAALDYGFTHYTVVLLGAIDSDGDWHIVDEHAKQKWLPERHAEAVKAMLGRHKIGPNERPLELSDLRTFVAGDDVFGKQRDGKTVAQDYSTHGITLRSANMDRVNGWAEVLRLLGDVDATPQPKRPRIFISPRCARLIECIPDLQHDPLHPEDVLKVDTDEDGLGGDDPGDALRYLVASKMREVKVGRVGGT